MHPVAWPAEAATVRAIRHAVFVVEQGVPPDLEWDGSDGNCLHLVARDRAGRPLGTVRMTPAGHIGRMAVLAAHRGQGVGSALLAAVLAAARARGLAAVHLNAQLGAAGFYARHGFAAEGETFMEAGIPHRRMTLRL